MPLVPGYLRAAAVAGTLALAGAAAAQHGASGTPGQTVGDAVKAGKGSSDPVVAKVDTVEIRRSDVLQALSAMPAQVQQLPMAQVYPLILERMIDGKLLAGAARGQKLQDDAEIKRKVAEYQD